MSVKSKIDKIEKLLSAGNNEKELVIYSWGKDFVEESYFKNKEEKRLFVDWYLEKFWQGQKAVTEIDKTIADKR